MLKFEGAWRFEPPPDGALHHSAVPNGFVNDCFELIGKVATQGSRKAILEHFKTYFASAAGISDSSSSSVGWAETDLRGYMSEAAANAPLFIEALFDGCEALRERGDPDFFAPNAGMINKLLAAHEVGYRIEPPRLILLERADQKDVVVPVPDRPPTLAERAVEVFQRSARRLEELLAGGGHDREAVQEILWLLESVTTAFRGIDTAVGTIEGKYFNQIVRELRQHAGAGTSLDRIMDWMTALHGYLSSPAGGAVRHGLDLNRGVEISHSEARLFCNLARSYLAFLLAEHERLATAPRSSRRCLALLALVTPLFWPADRPWAAQAPATATVDTVVKPFVSKHCSGCHNPAMQSGVLNLELLPFPQLRRTGTSTKKYCAG